MTDAPFPTPLVSSDWLAARLGEEDLSIIDASWRMPGKGDAHESYRKQHIPGAVFFPIDEIADKHTPLPHMLPHPDEFARAVGALGISDQDRIVVYDDHGLFSAARVWWTFRAMGHEDVSVLDGGLPKWLKEGRPVTDEMPSRDAKEFAAFFRGDHVADAAFVRKALGDGKTRVLDARPAARFEGKDAEPRVGLRTGHMPGARSVPFATLIAGDGTLKPRAELEAILAAAGAGLETDVVTTCGSGVTAAIVSLALEAIGHRRHALYDGSWAEWGGERNDPDAFPVVTGAG